MISGRYGGVSKAAPDREINCAVAGEQTASGESGGRYAVDLPATVVLQLLGDQLSRESHCRYLLAMARPLLRRCLHGCVYPSHPARR